MSSNISIREASPEDAQLMFDLRVDAFRHSYPILLPTVSDRTWDEVIAGFDPAAVGHYAKLLAGPHSRGWVAMEGAKAIGIIAAKTDDDIVILMNLFVVSDHQSIGIGRQLTERAIEWAGSKTVELSVAQFNTRAIELYKKLGFIQAGEPYPGSYSPLLGDQMVVRLRLVRQ